jgi:hypothetical protein
MNFKPKLWKVIFSLLGAFLVNLITLMFRQRVACFVPPCISEGARPYLLEPITVIVTPFTIVIIYLVWSLIQKKDNYPNATNLTAVP